MQIHEKKDVDHNLSFDGNYLFVKNMLHIWAHKAIFTCPFIQAFWKSCTLLQKCDL